MKKKTLLFLLTGMLILMIFLISFRFVHAQTKLFYLTWTVIDSGGVGGSTDNYTIQSSLGQPVTGSASSENTTIISGFWTWFKGALHGFLNFLPVIYK
jgi:hypothetical protein